MALPISDSSSYDAIKAAIMRYRTISEQSHDGDTAVATGAEAEGVRAGERVVDIYEQAR